MSDEAATTVTLPASENVNLDDVEEEESKVSTY